MTAIKSLKVLLIALSCAYISTLSAPAQGDDATAQQPPIQPASANGNEARLLEDACSGNLEAMQAAIKEGVNINCRTTEGNTVLTLAAANGHLETVTFLALKSQAINTTNINNQRTQQPTLVLRNMPQGHTQQTSNDQTTTAAKNGNNISGHKQPTLKSKETPPKKRRKADNSAKEEPLIILTESDSGIQEEKDDALLVAVKSGDLNAVKEALASGANVNTVNAQGNSVLHFAATNNNHEIIQELLNNGANLFKVNKNNKTAMDIAECMGHTEILNLLENAQKKYL